MHYRSMGDDPIPPCHDILTPSSQTSALKLWDIPNFATIGIHPSDPTSAALKPADHHSHGTLLALTMLCNANGSMESKVWAAS